MKRRPALTGREIQMLAHVARGLSNHQIAQLEHVSTETVKTHLYNAFRKLRAANRAHTVAIAYHVGIFAAGTQFGPASEPSPLAPARRSAPQQERSSRQ